MKRLPLICSVAAVAVLSASLAYWGLQLFKPKQRPIAPPPAVQAPEVNVDAARGLFGGQTAVAQVSNYQLRGVVAAANGRGSAAIISADGQPAKAYGVGKEVAPGVTVKDVQPRFVTLMEGGIQKRLDLAVDEGSAANGVQPMLPPPSGPQPVPQPVPVPPPQPAPAPQQPASAPIPGQGVSLPPVAQQPGQPGAVPAPVPGTVQGPPAQMAPAQPVTTNPAR
ncbi:type II secretion system protein N [Pseudoduganella sp. UC29_106]|uniref:type II secretion system protein N n=1 Tax=Pseudoduganella sp. UC29_106 TaxID=3374553 RepID=UPI00375693C3